VADKSKELILAALSRAAAEPNGLPLHGGKTLPGLFPTTPLGKQTAQRCVQEGYLSTSQAVPDNAYKTKPGAEGFVITDKGLSFLLAEANPRPVLEDLVRVLEARQAQTTELLHLAGRMRTDLLNLKTAAERVLQQVPRTEALTATLQTTGTGDRVPCEVERRENVGPRTAPTADQVAALHRAVLSHLGRWQSSGATEDYPLAELFRHLQAGIPGLTIGRFHDALRDLHDADRIYLHPWTGPLYDLPEPAFALLVGHLVASYASARSSVEAAVEAPESATLLRFPGR
jgi:hypothetical protein